MTANHGVPHHTSFSDFFHNASPEEKERVMLEVAREATNDQRKQVGLPPHHTSPEKEAFDRFAGATKGNDLIALLKPEPSFTEKTLEEFRERYSHWTEGVASSIDQWLSTKLELAQGSGRLEQFNRSLGKSVETSGLAYEREIKLLRDIEQLVVEKEDEYIRGTHEGAKFGVLEERERILTLIESKKKLESWPDNCMIVTSPENKAWNAALTSLAAELEDNETAP